jgi:hypothetical protein
MHRHVLLKGDIMSTTTMTLGPEVYSVPNSATARVKRAVRRFGVTEGVRRFLARLPGVVNHTAEDREEFQDRLREQDGDAVWMTLEDYEEKWGDGPHLF